MRGRLPAGRGGVRLAHEPCASKGHKARGVTQGIGEGEGAPNAPEMGQWQSSRRIVPQAGSGARLVGKVGNRWPRDPLEGRRSRASRFLGGPMGETPGAPTVSRKLQRMAQQAKRDPAMVFNNVLHWIDREFLREAYRQTRKSSAPGVDQVTAQPYAEHLDDNLRDLHERLRDHR